MNVAQTHAARVAASTSELMMAPNQPTVFSRLIDRLYVYKLYTPQTKEDMAEIIAVAKALQQAAGA